MATKDVDDFFPLALAFKFHIYILPLVVWSWLTSATSEDFSCCLLLLRNFRRHTELPKYLRAQKNAVSAASGGMTNFRRFLHANTTTSQLPKTYRTYGISSRAKKRSIGNFRGHDELPKIFTCEYYYFATSEDIPNLRNSCFFGSSLRFRKLRYSEIAKEKFSEVQKRKEPKNKRVQENKKSAAYAWIFFRNQFFFVGLSLFGKEGPFQGANH